MATKKYICAFCARAFTRLEHKQRHERSHTNEKPFHCLSCSSSFVRRDLLQRHCRTVHNIILTKDHTVKPVAAEEKEQEIGFGENSDSSISSKRIDEAKDDKKRIKNIRKDGDLLNIINNSNRVNYLLQEEVSYSFLLGYMELNKNELLSIKGILKGVLMGLNANRINPAVYTIISLGYHIDNDRDKCIQYYTKAWNLVNETLNEISSYSSVNANMIFSNLYLLSLINLQYDYTHPDLSVESMFSFLNDVSDNILQNTTIEDAELLWAVYLLLSKYFIKRQPPKIYPLLLDYQLLNKPLKTTMANFAKNMISVESAFIKEIFVLTLINELNHLKSYNSLLLFDLRNSLHNSIILIVKLLANNTFETSHVNDTIDFFKKKLVINSPVKYTDLLSNYIFYPQSEIDWNLLNVSLEEFNLKFHNNLASLNHYDLVSFFTDAAVDGNITHISSLNLNEVNNNLGIISFPLLFNSQFLNKRMHLKLEYNNQFEKNLNFIIMEWGLTLQKVLMNLFNLNDLTLPPHTEKNWRIFENNYILQLVVYLLNDESKQFQFNDGAWIKSIFVKFLDVLHKWVDFINVDSNLGVFRFIDSLNNLIHIKLSSGFQPVSAPAPSMRLNLQPVLYAGSNSTSIPTSTNLSNASLDNYQLTKIPPTATIQSTPIPSMPVIPPTYALTPKLAQKETLLPPILSRR